MEMPLLTLRTKMVSIEEGSRVPSIKLVGRYSAQHVRHCQKYAQAYEYHWGRRAKRLEATCLRNSAFTLSGQTITTRWVTAELWNNAMN